MQTDPIAQPYPPTQHRILRRTAAVAALAAALATFALIVPAARAHPVVPSTAFDPESVSWTSIRDATLTEFRTFLTEKLIAGYLVAELDIDAASGEPRVGAVFQRNPDNRQTRIRWDMTTDQYSAEWADARGDGLRLVDQETYVVNGMRYWAAAWVKNVEGYRWASYRSADSAAFDEQLQRLRNDGYLPIQIDAYMSDAGVRYSSVWVENTDRRQWQLVRDLGPEAFKDRADAYEARYRMVDFEYYIVGGGSRRAAIWVENIEGRHWATQYDLSAAGYANRYYRYYDLGYRLVDFERYETASGTRYAGIWRQNSDLPNWSLREEVEQKIEEVQKAHDVPGISVTIFQNGKLRYRRGHGYADKADLEWLDSRHVMRLASVSKAVAGVLLMQAVERNDVDLDDRTDSYLPQLPWFHTHTVGNTVSNRSCIRHYNDDLDGFTDEHYDTALEAAEEFWDDELVCTPGQYEYSTHAYTVFGAVLERVVGDPVAEILEDRITKPYGLTTLRAEDRGDSSVRRTRIYDGGNDVISRDDLSWKVLGGGLEASSYDLARFGAKLLAGEILSSASLTTMWTKPNDAKNYGFGWNLDTERGRRVVFKDGVQPGANSYLRMYPQDGIVIAVLTNRRDGGHDAPGLGREIGKLMLEELYG